MQSELTDSSRRRSKRALPLHLLSGVLGAMLALFMPLMGAQARGAVVLNVDGAIGPAVADYVVRELEAASPIGTGLVVLRMDTPGGLDTSMREIIRPRSWLAGTRRHLRGSKRRRAASAGNLIMYASAVAAMAPGTNLGAATPVELQGAAVDPAGRQERRRTGRRGTRGRRCARPSTMP